ncbi:poly-gamma-glutamate hydrolase family protein [Mycolicibacter longobardus]|uniref:poly-gamma-glutamate hydrolase family protein n=1 Tax=Mycolicibacter longobardus TaxID=1108812 RepID=UPI000A15D169|nr:poly-gamma-glutamate hydrolase family protein [Mycolicibacter longobardus]
MPATLHTYFAYGSNLCAQQMARRCPDAADPRPATLADHDWLINQRGVATVEPFPGSRVHGVLWRVSDHDLAALDSAEGVPLRYRRDRLTVHTPDGPSTAWVYIDHRVLPGVPRPGYLERIIGAAMQHELPPPWIEFLRRWDPNHWPLPLPANSPVPQSLSELLADPGVVEHSVLRSRFGFLAIHGGGLEKMTDVIAERAADAAGASVYLVRHPDGYLRHLPSTGYRAEESARLAEFLDHVDVVVSLHGYGRIGRSTQLLAGGGNRRLAAHLARCLDLPGYQVVTDIDAIPAGLRGLHPANPVNRVRGGGTQLELSPRVRGISPRSQPPGDDGLSPVTAALVRGLATAARSGGSARLDEGEAKLGPPYEPGGSARLDEGEAKLGPPYEPWRLEV